MMMMMISFKRSGVVTSVAAFIGLSRRTSFILAGGAEYVTHQKWEIILESKIEIEPSVDPNKGELTSSSPLFLPLGVTLEVIICYP